LAGTVTPKQVIIYVDDNGREPFTEWLNNLRDSVGCRRISTRVARLRQGNYGDCKPIGEKLYELRMFFGSGYRVYFGEHQNNTVVLLCGGDKSSQGNDIRLAKIYWNKYLDRSSRDV
jgi:putative addiction module killer protein